MNPDEKEIVTRKGMVLQKTISMEKASESRNAPKMPEKTEISKFSVDRSEPPKPTANPFPSYLTLGGVPLGHRGKRR